MTKLLFISGSIRNGSFNTQLTRHAYNLARKTDGIDAELVDLADYPMPIVNQDMHESDDLPEHAARFKALIQSCDGFFIASPEYNGFFTPLLKNALDWASRSYIRDDTKNTIPTFEGKIAAISSASPGPMGGLRGLPYLRIYLGGLGLHVVPKQAAIGNAGNAFDENGHLAHESQNKMFDGVIDQFIQTTKALRG